MAPKLDLSVEPSLDSLRLYLREIGKVPLLTARPGGVAREAHRAWRHVGEAAHDRGEPAARRLDRQGVPRSRAVVPRPDPGGVARPDPGGREVRLSQGLQVLDVRHVVDPAGGHACDRRQGAHDPDPGAHGREAQQGRAHRAPARAAARSRAEAGGDRRGARDPDRGGARDPPHGAAAGLAREADRRGGGLLARRLRARTTRPSRRSTRRRCRCGARTSISRSRRFPSASGR